MHRQPTNLLANTWQICRAKTADRPKRQKQQHGDKTHLSSKQANRQDDHYLSRISICDYRGAQFEPEFEPEPELEMMMMMRMRMELGAGLNRGSLGSQTPNGGGVVAMATWAHKTGKCQNDALCCLSYLPQAGKKRLADCEPGQMQLVFKCGRASEHDAKTSHHHLRGNDTWTWTWAWDGTWMGPTSLATKEPSRAGSLHAEKCLGFCGSQFAVI